MVRRTVFLNLVIAAASLLSPIVKALSLADSPARQLVTDYLDAFNSGDAARMRSFVERHVAPAALAVRPVEVRVAAMTQIQADLKQLKLEQVQGLTDTSIAIVVKASTGMSFEMVFLHDRSQPPLMLQLSMMSIEDSPAADVPALPRDQQLARVDDFLKSEAAANRFSGVVLIAQGDSPLYHQAFGFASIEHQVPNLPDTKFNLGSINKRFTELAIEILAAQGKLSLADPLGKYLPDFPNTEARAKVTIQHLVQMQGGIGDIFGEKFDAVAKDHLRHNRDFIPLFAEEPLHFAPGTRREYSNGGYVLLGAIIEKASGQDYYEFIHKNIFDVAGMSNTAWYEADAIVPNLANGYTLEGSSDGRLRNNHYTRPARGSAAGGGYSTAEDLLKFARALATGKLKSAHNALGIAGGAPGINAAVDSGLPGDMTLIVLANLDPPTAESTAEQLRALLGVSD